MSPNYTHTPPNIEDDPDLEYTPTADDLGDNLNYLIKLAMDGMRDRDVLSRLRDILEMALYNIRDGFTDDPQGLAGVATRAIEVAHEYKYI